ncbi:MAG: DNA mismatch repair endonuclease MutL, partial [Verrucomicrobia bacterium]|nr:DNA mismatch repair endonuclease MutL [Verrucomicrobiota bacterium]
MPGVNRIKLLPDHVANQIAAGEVVERPASVVKELVENALDAQASRITVEIQAGGRSLIRVTDDGLGMSRDDALLCLERHATSKIRRAEDLASISTMGFRGEALPSIASVSRFTLTTREREVGVQPSGCTGEGNSLKAGLQPIEGTQIVVNGGKISEVKAAGSATGTSVEVRQLFFNLPARRKFLRTEETEAAHVLHYLTLAALAHPGVAFTFVKDTRTVWQLPGQKSGDEIAARLPAVRERLRALMGDTKLIEVDFSAPLENPPSRNDEEESFETALPAGTTDSGLRAQDSRLIVWGLMGAPGVSRGTREDQHVFVNRRPVENRGINFALMEGYHTALMKGRYPVCCLFLEIDPAAVDVNIHPAKREVKFHREAEVRKLVAQAVREALQAFHSKSGVQSPESGVGSSKLKVQSSKSGATDEAGEQIVKVGIPFDVKTEPEFSTPSLPEFPLPLKPKPEWPARQTETPSLQMGFSSFRPAPTLPGHAPRPTPPPSPGFGAASHAVPSPSSNLTPDAAHHAPTHTPTPLLSVPLRLVGVIGKLYVVLESDRGLVLLD